MNITITLGWWIVPALLTAATLIYLLWPVRWGSYGADVARIFVFLGGVIASLVAWLVWSLVAHG